MMSVVAGSALKSPCWTGLLLGLEPGGSVSWCLCKRGWSRAWPAFPSPGSVTGPSAAISRALRFPLNAGAKADLCQALQGPWVITVGNVTALLRILAEECAAALWSQRRGRAGSWERICCLKIHC